MTKYTSDEVLDKLIRAGLGDVEREKISREEYRRAMAGEVVRRPRPRHGSARKANDEPSLPVAG
jgi:hypothetical protein